MILIAEWKKDKTLISKIICKVTKKKYSHTSMIIKRFDGILYHCELTIKKGKDYHYTRINNIRSFLNLNKRVELFIIGKVSKGQCDKCLSWWMLQNKINRKYGVLQVISMLWKFPARKYAEMYYKKTGKVLKPLYNHVKASQLVCSNAVDYCLKDIGIDLFKTINESLSVPGDYAKILKKYEV